MGGSDKRMSGQMSIYEIVRETIDKEFEVLEAGTDKEIMIKKMNSTYRSTDYNKFSLVATSVSVIETGVVKDTKPALESVFPENDKKPVGELLNEKSKRVVRDVYKQKDTKEDKVGYGIPKAPKESYKK